MVHDNNGIEVRSTDMVCVTAVGYGARHADNGIIRKVIKIGRTRVLIHDVDGNERSVGGPVIAVMRRDGQKGFEHNRRPRNLPQE
jgi:hypothetical protein